MGRDVPFPFWEVMRRPGGEAKDFEQVPLCLTGTDSVQKPKSESARTAVLHFYSGRSVGLM